MNIRVKCFFAGLRLLAALVLTALFSACPQVEGVKASDNRLLSITASRGDLSPLFNPDYTDYELLVPFDAESVRLEAVPGDGGARVSPGRVVEKPLGPVDTVVVFTVYPQDWSAVRDYTVTVRRKSPVSKNTNLASVWVADKDGNKWPFSDYHNDNDEPLAFSPGLTAYTVKVPNSMERIALICTPTNENAAVSDTGHYKKTAEYTYTELAVGIPEEINVTVTSEDRTETKTYTFTVTRAAPDPGNNRLRRLWINGKLAADFKGSDAAYTANVSWADSVTLKAEAEELGARIYDSTDTAINPEGSAVTAVQDLPFSGAGVITYTLRVASVDGSDMAYTITLTRLSKDASLGSITVTATAAGSLETWTPALIDFLPTDDRSWAYGTEETPLITTQSANITVTGTLPTGSLAQISSPLENTLSEGVHCLTLTVTAQDTTVRHTYSIWLERLPVDSNADLSNLQVQAGGMTHTLISSSPSPETNYSLSIPAATAGVTITATPASSLAKTLTVKGSNVSFGASRNVTEISPGITTIPVVVTAQDGTTKTYVITLYKPGTAGLSITLLLSDGGDFITIDRDLPDSNIFIYQNGIASGAGHQDLPRTVEFSFTGETGYWWYVDGKKKGNNNESLLIDALNYSLTKHRVTLMVQQGDIIISREIFFTVTMNVVEDGFDDLPSYSY
ncbi:putative lipoprotein [Treponema primitia ZAS-2]|uniref:Putative lipoprotein n=1 Tax=Treponema primitia (strain ATCC BAA-887 / DSM 12427 / ZAS-2) TaxID=545694 RepID=F5YLQ5_TREPZ|nr:cadherin-like beta sandwich domain-containing protein [Treponema primitia]AEF86730.1 putative lipoprotein [Treponema primitia ZAS-2]